VKTNKPPLNKEELLLKEKYILNPFYLKDQINFVIPLLNEFANHPYLCQAL
jgi:hypothetical protein